MSGSDQIIFHLSFDIFHVAISVKNRTTDVRVASV